MNRLLKGQLKLNRLGKITALLLSLLTITLLYFVLNGINERSAEATKSIEPLAGPKGEDISNVGKEKSRMQESSGGAEGESSVQAPLRMGKVVYLTFDDGPHAVTPDILHILEKYNAKATFFMLEPNMQKYPEAVQLMIEKGHTVGVHGVSHDISKVYASPESFVGEMNEAIAFIAENMSVQTRLVRAPFGSNPHITPAFKQAADEEEMILWDWNIDSVDWKFKNGEYVQKVIEQTERLVEKEPLVVLLHEKPSTLAYLEELLTYFQDHEYEMDTLNETMIPIQFK